MMTVSSAISTALSSETLRFAWLLRICDDLLLTNHGVELTYGGETYVSGGDILRLPAVVRERAIKLQSYSIEFSNVDGALSAELLARDRTGERCEVLLVFLDADGDIIGDEAISLYRGSFDSWSERDTANSATITLKITSPWAKPNLTAGRITSNHHQQDRYTGDRFFEFAHEEKNTIAWGGSD